MTGFQVFVFSVFIVSSMLLIGFTDLLSLLFPYFKSLILFSVSMGLLNKAVVLRFWTALFIFLWIIYLSDWWGGADHNYLEALEDDRHGRLEGRSQAVVDKSLYSVLIFLCYLQINENEAKLFGKWSEIIDPLRSLFG